MSAVLQAPPELTQAEQACARWLPQSGAPWRPCFEGWPQAEAQRWRAVLAQGQGGQFALLAEQACDAMLHERVESLLRASVPWVCCDAASVDALLGAGEADFRALDAVSAGHADALGAAAQGPLTQELSARHLAEQASPVVRLLDATLYDALQDGVSDIHFECTVAGLAIRYRIDGVMLAVRDCEGSAVAEQLVSRLKVMSELDIGERRLPQDGRFKLRVSGREIDFRLSIMPSVFGEDAVVRVLDRAQVQQTQEQAQGGLTLDAVGFDAATRDTLRSLARQPYGMLLVTGPTGSGKTTTLYAAISEVNTGHDKIITIEDPVEYQLPGVVQIPVNEKKGLTFARGLRSILRHDPDRVMVGEIRDAETAQIAVQAALTGHLVFSTVHANNVFDVIGRFTHMGLDLYNVVSALNAVVAQRLLRLNCTRCSTPEIPSHELLARLKLPARTAYFQRGMGCTHCRGTGYKGRRAVAELLVLDDGLRDLIVARAPTSQLKQAARERGMRSLREAAIQMVCQGETSIEELDRVTLAD